MGNKHTNTQKTASTSSAGEGETKSATTTALRNPTSESVGLQVLTKEGTYFDRTKQPLIDYNKGSDIGPSLMSYGDRYSKQFDFSYLNPANNTYEVLRVQSYLASGGFAHVFMAKQVLADGGLGRSFAVKLMYKRGDTELDRLDKREVGQGLSRLHTPKKKKKKNKTNLFHRCSLFLLFALPLLLAPPPDARFFLGIGCTTPQCHYCRRLVVPFENTLLHARRGPPRLRHP